MLLKEYEQGMLTIQISHKLWDCKRAMELQATLLLNVFINFSLCICKVVTKRTKKEPKRTYFNSYVHS